LRRRRFQVGIDEDVPFRGNDEVGGQIARTYVVEIAGDFEWFERGGPVGRYGGVNGAR
jgi:hypothetical protein